MKEQIYVGLDLHKRYSFVVVKDATGKRIKQAELSNKDEEIIAFFSCFKDYTINVALEATSNYYWIYELLSKLGIEVKLAHPLKTKMIAEAKIKSDKIDASILADLLRSNMLPTSYIPNSKIRELRELLRHRLRLVQRRSKLKLLLRDILTKCHYPDYFADISGQRARSYIEEYDLPPVFRLQCNDTLAQIDFLNDQISSVTQEIRKVASNFPEAERLQRLRGIGVFSSLLILAEIGDIKRFPSPKKLTAFAGLCPGLHQSGNVCYNRPITKEGSRYLRWVLCEAVFHTIKVPGPLRDFFYSLRKSKGVQKAVIATARKMLVGIYFVLHDNAEFNPVRKAQYSFV